MCNSVVERAAPYESTTDLDLLTTMVLYATFNCQRLQEEIRRIVVGWQRKPTSALACKQTTRVGLTVKTRSLNSAKQKKHSVERIPSPVREGYLSVSIVCAELIYCFLNLVIIDTSIYEKVCGSFNNVERPPRLNSPLSGRTSYR